MSRTRILLLAALASYFLMHSVPKTGEALKVFEWEYFSAAESAVSTGLPVTYGLGKPAVEHPPFYVHLLALVMEFSGPEVRAARLMGVFLLLSACLPLFLLARALGAGAAAFTAAMALFLLTPAVIQGSTIIGAADTGLLPPLLLLFCWAVLYSREKPAPYGPAAGAGLFCLCLWAKFTTSLALPVFFLGWRAAERDARGFKTELGIFSAGAGLFVLTWALYCFMVVGMQYFSGPLAYPLPQLAAGMHAGGAVEKLLRFSGDLMRVAAWVSPFLLFSAAASFRARPEEKSGPAANWLLLLGAMIFFGYTAVRGSGGGFPKYQLPALAFFCLAAGMRFSRELAELRARELAGLFFISAAAFLYHRFAVGDAVLYTQEMARFAAVNGAGAVLGKAAFSGLLYFFPFAAAVAAASWFAGWRPGRAFFLVSLCFAFGYNISQNAFQLAAGYSTTYAYGTSGAGEAAGFVRENTRPMDPVIGAFETLYAAGNKRALLMPEKAWSSPAAFLAYQAQTGPAAVVCGLGTNTAEQQAEVFDSPEVRRALSASYAEHVFGSYTVWLKKERK